MHALCNLFVTSAPLPRKNTGKGFIINLYAEQVITLAVFYKVAARFEQRVKKIEIVFAPFRMLLLFVELDPGGFSYALGGGEYHVLHRIR